MEETGIKTAVIQEIREIAKKAPCTKSDFVWVQSQRGL